MSLSKIEFMGLTACYDVGKVSDLNESRFPCSWSVTAFGNMRTQLRTTWSLLLPFYLLALFLFEHSECLLGQFSDYALCETKHFSKLVQTLSPPRIDKLPSKLRFFRRSSTSMKYVADCSFFVSDVHIKLTNPMTNDVIWQIQLFAKGAISTNIVVELSLVYSYQSIHSNPGASCSPTTFFGRTCSSYVRSPVESSEEYFH